MASESASATENTNPGPFFFAWVDASETTFNESHHREDEDVYSWKIEHSEGDFATLELEVRNPRIGLLAPGRAVWAWLAFNKNWRPEPAPQETTSDSEAFGSEGEPASEAPDIVPLFFGRLVALPEDLQEEIVSLSFLARPEDYAAQKEAVAATKRVAPYWDGIWFSPETRYDPDNVLESRPELWHIDRVTHEVSTSNIITGEDGTTTLHEDDIIYESMRMSYGQVPLRRVDVVASVAWDQIARTKAGGVDISDKCYFGAGNSILTFTGDGLVANWPKPGASLEGGWHVFDSSLTRVDGIGQAVWGYGLRNQKGVSGAGGSPFGRSYIASENWHDALVPGWAGAYSFGGGGGGQGFNFTVSAHILGVPRWRLAPKLILGYDVSRKKSEQIAFTLQADVQALVTDTNDEDSLSLTFSSSEIGSGVDPLPMASSDDEQQYKTPLTSPSARVYFSTARGTQSIEYLIALARSRLLARSRAVDIDFEFPFMTGIEIDLSCRKNIVLEDRRLPGGVAGGKIKSYSLSCDGDSGELRCEVTIGCTVGKGAAIEAGDVGTPTYVEEGYVGVSEYQFYENAFIMPIAGEVTYESILGLGASDDGIDFDHLDSTFVVKNVEKTGTYQEQAAAMGSAADEPNVIFDRLNKVPTKFVFHLKPLTGGPFETNRGIAVSLLMVPKTIDLEAESTE